MRKYFTVYIDSEAGDEQAIADAFNSVLDCLDGHNNSGLLPEGTNLDWDTELENEEDDE